MHATAGHSSARSLLALGMSREFSQRRWRLSRVEKGEEEGIEGMGKGFR